MQKVLMFILVSQSFLLFGQRSRYISNRSNTDLDVVSIIELKDLKNINLDFVLKKNILKDTLKAGFPVEVELPTNRAFMIYGMHYYDGVPCQMFSKFVFNDDEITYDEEIIYLDKVDNNWTFPDCMIMQEQNPGMVLDPPFSLIVSNDSEHIILKILLKDSSESEYSRYSNIIPSFEYLKPNEKRNYLINYEMITKKEYLKINELNLKIVYLDNNELKESEFRSKDRNFKIIFNPKN